VRCPAPGGSMPRARIATTECPDPGSAGGPPKLIARTPATTPGPSRRASSPPPARPSARTAPAEWPPAGSWSLKLRCLPERWRLRPSLVLHRVPDGPPPQRRLSGSGRGRPRRRRAPRWRIRGPGGRRRARGGRRRRPRATPATTIVVVPLTHRLQVWIADRQQRGETNSRYLRVGGVTARSPMSSLRYRWPSYRGPAILLTRCSQSRRF